MAYTWMPLLYAPYLPLSALSAGPGLIPSHSENKQDQAEPCWIFAINLSLSAIQDSVTAEGAALHAAQGSFCASYISSSCRITWWRCKFKQKEMLHLKKAGRIQLLGACRKRLSLHPGRDLAEVKHPPFQAWVDVVPDSASP